jgi:hypothetical protein
MRIIKATEAIPIEHPVFLIFGQPGIGKTSLGYSADEPLLFDVDKGAHRAVNRRDTLEINSWEDIDELTRNQPALDPYKTVVPDTVGRVLDMMTASILAENPKWGYAGNLNQQGWGVLKTRFRTWMTRLRGFGKDVVLIAHEKEERDGDVRIVRPDITGGSYGEILKIADFVGYIQMVGKQRVLDFSPTERWIGKNPAGWEPFKVPAPEKAQAFMADLMKHGREALGKISAVSAEATQQVDDWRAAIAGYTTPEECTAAIPKITSLPPIIAAPVKKLLNDRAKALNFTFDKKAAAFVLKAA